ncbi:MAG: M48 family metallopeptidase [Alphaproteobacteria bacterium]|nr:M48 family metallopeptidase [Alphaproteobacteria bacterium]
MDRYASAARKLAENIRYSGDTLRHYDEGDSAVAGRVLGSVYQNELRVSSEVTPGLADHLKSVCSQLHLPANSVDAFVYASPDIQAECYSGSTQNCILRFSSALIDLLDDDEFMFVVGHEVGHFLLGHGLARIENSADSIEYYIQQRAQEISSDRIGLISCQSLDVAIRAMMKTVSGLTDEHLRFDVSAFIRQLDETPHTGGHHASTHPSILVRCKALLWFSLNDAFNRGGEDFCRDELLKLDQRIQNDLDKYVDGPAREIIKEAEENLLLWVIANHVVQDGVLDKKEQKTIAELIGEQNLERLKNFLSEIPIPEVRDEVFQRMRTAREDLERMIPTSFEMTFREIEEKVSAALG